MSSAEPFSFRGTIGSVLAQSGQGASEVLVWAMLLIVAAIGGGFVILMVRKRMLSALGEDIGSEGLFDALRRMRDKGELSQVEYDVARKRILDKVLEGKASAAAPTRTPAQAAILQAAAHDEAVRAKKEEMLAPPGYDLTGEPLPGTGRRPNHHDR